MHKSIFESDCCYEFAVTPQSSDQSASHPALEAVEENNDVFGLGGPTDLVADSVALPDHGGQFPVAEFVGPELAAYANAEPPACDEESLVNALLARMSRSCHRISAKEYAKLVSLMHNGKMVDFWMPHH